MRSISSIILFVFILWSWIYSANVYGLEYQKFCEKAGDFLQIAIPAYAVIYTFYQKDAEGGKEFAISYGTSIGITYGLKNIVKEKRPNTEARNSFPSGHTASAFSGAVYTWRRYNRNTFETIQGWLLIFLASFTGYTRIETGNHYFHDVLAGALIGGGISYLFTHPYKLSILKNTSFNAYPDFEILPDHLFLGLTVYF